MKRNCWLLIAVLCAAAARGAAREPVTAGRHLFALNCSVGYCHGVDGGAGRGPRLRDRDWEKGYLYKTIENGIPGSSMPAWKDKLSQQQVSAIVDYILSISREQPEATHSAAETAAPASNVPAESAAARGKELFFDPANDRSCGVCHGVREAGSSVGPALDALARKPAAQILDSFVKLNADSQPGLRVRTVTGETICGIKAGEDSKNLQIYDLTSAGPPVLRTLLAEEIAGRDECDDLHVHAGLRLLTRGQLSDIVAFLKSSESSLK